MGKALQLYGSRRLSAPGLRSKGKSERNAEKGSGKEREIMVGARGYRGFFSP